MKINALLSRNSFTELSINRWLTLYTLVNVIAALIIATRFYQSHTIPDSIFGSVFGITHAIGHLGLLAFIFIFPLYLLATFIKQKKIIILIALMISCVGLTALLADTFIYQQYRFHINAMVMELFIAGGSEIISFPLSMWLMITALVVFILFAQFFIAKWLIKLTNNTQQTHKLLIWLVPICLISSNIMHIYGDGTFNRDITKQSRILPLAQPTTAKKLMAKYGLLDVEANKTQAMLKQKKNKGQLSYPITTIETQTKDQYPNIVMIVIDSWRSDMMSESITPNIAKFSQQAMQFTDHYSGSNNTRHGTFSLMYGLPGTYWDAMLKQQQGPVLIKTLNKLGYQSHIFASAKLTMPEFDQTLFVDIPNLRKFSKGELPWQRDKDLINDYLNWQKDQKNNEPSFSLLFFDAAHGFSIPDSYKKPFEPSLKTVNYLALNDNYEVKPFLNLYKNALHYVDSQIALVLERLAGELDNTIVIITGDHGKEFNDSKQGYWGHNSNFSNYQTKVPLIIHWPNKAAKEVNFKTSHFSIAPTLLKEALGVTTPAINYSVNKSLFEQTESLPWVFLGRTGYYAIKDEQYLYELDRLGNFTIFDNNYQRVENVPLNINYVQQAMNEMSRFYRK